MNISEKLDALRDSENGLVFVNRKDQETRLSWRQLRQDALVVAGGLQARGIRPGERIALVFRTEPDFFRAFFGCLYAGAVPTPLYPPVRLGRLEAYHSRTAGMLRDVDAALVLASGQIRKLLGRAVHAASPRLGCMSLSELGSGIFHAQPVHPDKLGLVQFSSGTTDRPKPVALSHSAILSQGQIILDMIKANFTETENASWSGVSWLPLYHDMGLIGCVFPALLHDADLVLIRPEDFIARPALWLRALSRHKGIISPAPNFAFALCTQRIREADLAGVDLSSWRIALNGAESIHSKTLDDFIDRFSKWGLRSEAITPVYGLSEAALAVCFSEFKRPYKQFVHPKHGGQISVGKPLPGFSVEIRDKGNAVLPTRSVGQIWINGPSLMEGYFNQPKLTSEVLQDGWLKTGDLGFMHDGELYIVGRATDLIILNGKNHAPAPIEAVLDGLQGIRRGCVAAAGHRTEEAATESLLLFVEEDKSASKETKETLVARSEAHLLQTLQLQAKVISLPAGTLPRTSSGKIRRREALNLYQKGQLKAPNKMGVFRLVGALWDSRKHMPKRP